MTFFKLNLIALLVLFSNTCEAKILQILHTNDLHAALITAGAPDDNDVEYGGWAQVKTMMDRLTADAKSKGMETVRLDAGDFLEGTLAYFPDHGQNILKAFQSLGFDAVALGNHDWMMGAQNLDASFAAAPFPFPVLSANTELSPYLVNLNKQISDTAEIVRDGIKIGIVGLSTDEIAYKWITKVDSYKRDMKILDYRDSFDKHGNEYMGIGNEAAHDLRKNNDLVIALTHIGIDEDRKLAASSEDIDLIVGGHSHTILSAPVLVTNEKGEKIPVVQTGVNGKFIGKILIEVVPGKKPKLISYELVPVLHSLPRDPTVAALLDHAETRVLNLFGSEKLNKVVGKSDVRLVSGDLHATAYSKFIVDAMKDAADSEIAIDLGAFHNNGAQAKGDVTYRKLMEMYPRKLNVEQNEGLYVYRARIPGWVLKIALKMAVKYGYELSLSGVEYTTYTLKEDDYSAEKGAMKDPWEKSALSNERVDTISINGEPIRTFKKYRVAMPEFFVRGAYAISALTRLVIRDGRPTEFTIWDAAAAYLTKIGVITGTDFEGPRAHEYNYGAELIQEISRTLQLAPERNSPENALEK